MNASWMVWASSRCSLNGIRLSWEASDKASRLSRTFVGTLSSTGRAAGMLTGDRGESNR